MIQGVKTWSIASLLIAWLGLVESEAQLVEEIEEVLPYGSSNWEYLYYWDTNGGLWTPHDPVEFDPDFHSTWYGDPALYDGEFFRGTATPFGFGTISGLDSLNRIFVDQDGGTLPPAGERYTAYFRTSFTPTEDASALRFEGIIDDGAIFYIDGVEVGRTESMPLLVENHWRLLTDSLGSETETTEVFVRDLSLVTGVPVLVAISLHNSTPTSSDLGMNLRIVTGVAPDRNPPPNDHFDDAEVVSNQLPQYLLGRTDDTYSGSGATLEAGEPQHAGQAGVGSVWYTFTPSNDMYISVNAGENRGATRTNFDAIVAVYTGDAIDNLTEVASSTGGEDFRANAELGFDATGGTTYRIAVDGADNGGPPIKGDNFGRLALTISLGNRQPFTPIERLLDARSDWEYLLAAENDPDVATLRNQPVDPALFGDGDADFHTTWHSTALYDGPEFSARSPAPFWYGVINTIPVTTNIWRERDIDGTPATPDLVPPRGLRYASYFRTTFTPTNDVAHLGFKGLIDDGAVVFINGTRVSAINFIGDVSDWQALAISPFLSRVATEVIPQYGVAPNVSLPAGVEVEIAVTVRNNLSTSSDMAFDMEVYAIEEPPLDSAILTESNPVVISFEGAAPGDVFGLGDGGPQDNLAWLLETGGVADQTALPNSPPSAGHALHSKGRGILMRTGVVDLQQVDNREVVIAIDARSIREPEAAGTWRTEYLEVFIEGSQDGFLFDPIAELIPRITGIVEVDGPDYLKALELAGGAYTSFVSAPNTIPESTKFVRLAIRSGAADEFEHLLVDNIRFTVGSPPFEAAIIHDSATGQNHIRWPSDGASFYEVFFSPDLVNWTPIESAIGLRSTFHTPPDGTARGFYQVHRAAE